MLTFKHFVDSDDLIENISSISGKSYSVVEDAFESCFNYDGRLSYLSVDSSYFDIDDFTPDTIWFRESFIELFDSIAIDHFYFI